ncbi:MAG: ABC transporter ATP-binding protein/permease [Oscillospiraceae bacterium]|jgi:ATP-binding cassette subfamily B protein|nr:ABC transporter ATP-binding protein/permease [Oscillospiraceae bacterium]
MTDRTSAVEHAVNREAKPRLTHLFSLWLYTFRSTTLVSCIFLGLVIALALLRPALALIWERYIGAAQLASIERTMLPAALLLAAYFAIEYVAGMIERYCYQMESIERLDLVQANRLQEFMQTKMFAKLAAISPEYFEVSKINDNIEQTFAFVGDRWNGVSTDVMRAGFHIIGKAISVAGIAATLYIFNPMLCLIILFAPLPCVWFVFTNSKLQFKFRKEHAEALRKMDYFQNLMISVSGKELLTLGLHDFIFDKWKKLADDYTLAERKRMRHNMLLRAVDSLIANLVIAAGSILAIMMMAAGQITLGALAAVMQLTNTLSNDVIDLLRAVTTFASKKNEAAQFHDMMSLPETTGRAEPPEKSVIECRGLRYRYPLADRYVLNGVTLTVKAGEKVALVGENGAGKTTFVKLITDMLTPSDGELRAVSMNNFGTVMQDPSRYTTFTVGDNVFFGDVGRSRDEAGIEGALEFSGFDGAQKDALLGKDSGGTDLSGGQWQKLAIARAAYRDRDFIILDEPTGNLDPLAEAEAFKKYIDLAANKTVMFVTHRISAAALADRIIVFKDGAVIEDGKHEELLNNGGEYARLFREQSKWYGDHGEPT